MAGDGGDRAGRRAADDPGAARGQARPPRGRRAAVIEPAAVVGQVFRRDAISYLAPEHVQVAVEALVPDGQAVRPPRPLPYRGGGRVQVPPHPHPRHDVRGDPEARAGDVARALRRVGRLGQPRAVLSSTRRSSATTSSRPTATCPTSARSTTTAAVSAPTAPAASRRRAGGRSRAETCPRRRTSSAGPSRCSPRTTAPNSKLLPEYGEALLQVGRFQDAEHAWRRRSSALGRRASTRCWSPRSPVRLLVRLRTGEQEGWKDEAAITITEAMAVFEPPATTRVWRGPGAARLDCTEWPATSSLRPRRKEQALEEARLAGDVRQQNRAATVVRGRRGLRTDLGLGGDRALRADARAGVRRSPRRGPPAGLPREPVAMRGSFEERTGAPCTRARAAGGARPRRRGRARGHRGLADRDARRRRPRRRASCDAPTTRLSAVGEKFILSTVAGLLGQTQYALDRFDEAEQLGTLEAKELATEDDVDTQALWRCVRRRSLARRGRIRPGRGPRSRGARDPRADRRRPDEVRALLDLAEVLRLAAAKTRRGPRSEDAQALAEQKGSLVMASAASDLLAALDRFQLVS